MKRNVIKTYTGDPVNVVKGINLQVSDIQILSGEEVPWIPGNKWPDFKVNPKKNIGLKSSDKDISLPKPYSGVQSTDTSFPTMTLGI